MGLVGTTKRRRRKEERDGGCETTRKESDKDVKTASVTGKRRKSCCTFYDDHSEYTSFRYAWTAIKAPLLQVFTLASSRPSFTLRVNTSKVAASTSPTLALMSNQANTPVLVTRLVAPPTAAILYTTFNTASLTPFGADGLANRSSTFSIQLRGSSKCTSCNVLVPFAKNSSTNSISAQCLSSSSGVSRTVLSIQ
ncbi:hypothetical protein KCU77_g51, partial [Aureobasidium melanogenum]